MRVLIAEDTDSVRSALRLVMEHFGHEVVALATSGPEALAAYARTQPEVVLMDVQMPEMDGLECAAKLAQTDPHAQVVIVTGGRTTEQEARRAGACAFVEKPFDLDELDLLIHSLSRRRARALA